MAITIDGVTYRNLPEQVEKNKTDIEAMQANLEGIKKNAFTDVDVTEYPTLEDFLQSTGEEGIIYLYPDGTNFKQYIWEGEAWRFIGDTDLDISNMVTTDTDQPITGVKTIETDLAFNKEGNDPITWHIQPNAYNGLDILRNNVAVASFISSSVTTYSVIPSVSNIHSLGSTDRKWSNLHLGGKIFNLLFTVNNGVSDTFMVDGVNGQTKSAYTFLPSATASNDLGSTSLSWRSIYLTENANFSHASTQVVWAAKQNQYGNLELARNSTGLYSFASSGLFPNSNNQRDLGASALRWKDAYINGAINPNSVTISDIDANLTDIESKTMYVNGITTIVFYCKVVNYINANTILFKTNQKPTHIVNFTGRNQASGTYSSASTQFMINTDGEIIVLASAAANNEICFTLVY